MRRHRCVARNKNQGKTEPPRRQERQENKKPDFSYGLLFLAALASWRLKQLLFSAAGNFDDF
jgi:hypothetical protein